MFLFYALAVTPFCERVFWPGNMQANAWAANWALQRLHQKTSVAGNTITANRFSFQVARGCDAAEPVWLLTSAIIAFPAGFWRKLMGIVAGTFVLLVINLLRLVILFFVARNHPGLYDTLHEVLLPAVFIMLAIIMWGGWVFWGTGCNQFITDAKI